MRTRPGFAVVAEQARAWLLESLRVFSLGMAHDDDRI
jgi:hypothetical protein